MLPVTSHAMEKKLNILPLSIFNILSELTRLWRTTTTEKNSHIPMCIQSDQSLAVMKAGNN